MNEDREVDSCIGYMTPLSVVSEISENEPI